LSLTLSNVLSLDGTTNDLIDDDSVQRECLTEFAAILTQADITSLTNL